MSNNRFRNALQRKPQKTPPIWFMRQAGRYHRHYQAIKAKSSFMEMCKNPSLAAQVALGPIEDFDFDVSILFSDLLFPLEALGLGLSYDPGPKLHRALDGQTIKSLEDPARAVAFMDFQAEAMARTRSLLPADKSLIGFVGGPWTLFTYAVEGSHSGALGKAKCQMDLFEDFCDIIVPFLIDNISLQLDAGAEIVMIFDTAAGELPARDFESYVVPQVEKLAKAHPSRLGYYSKGTLSRHLRRLWGHLHWAGFGYDHRFDLSEVFGKQMTGFVQGNFDQALLFAEEASFEDMVLEYLEPFLRLSEAQRAGWVCGLGHGVLPGTPEGNVRSFVQIIRQSL